MEAHRLNEEDDEKQHCIHSGQTSSDAKPRRKKKMAPVAEKKRKGESCKAKSVKSKAKQVSAENTKNSGSMKRKRCGINDIYEDVEAKFTVMERAARVLASLDDKTPYFLKYMLPSNVTYSFWLIIPRKFGTLYLPNQDSTVILVDEWGKEYKTTYLIDRNGLSAGWRGFSLAHGLLKGDILIFRLIGPCKLQVHIVRVNGLDVIDAARCLMNMEDFGKTTNPDLAKKDSGKRKRARKYADCYLLNAPKVEDSTVEKCQNSAKSDFVSLPERSDNTSDGFGSEVVEGSEVPNHFLSANLHSTEASFLREHPCEGVRCR